MSSKSKHTGKTPPSEQQNISRFTIEPIELVEVVDEFSKLMEKIELYNPHVDKELIKRALRFAAVAHAGQRRKSGHPFIYHGIQTADILADLHLDSVMIACGILHDVVEDTDVTIEDVQREFGDEIANIIEGLTKISELKLRSREEQQAENFRKMILHTAKDPRTIIVRFADRLHNMRTLEYLPPESRKRISHETLEVFAPLAHRLGMYTIRMELEDLSFKWLYPEEYEKLQNQIEVTHHKRDDYLDQFTQPIAKRLDEEHIPYQLQWRMKHLYSIYLKMIRNNKGMDEVYDIFAVRVIVNTISECYHTLGIIHSMYTPIVERIKDFIATPKFNMYQSLHTTVVGKGGQLVEVQIRNWEMHQTAETGIAAHWRYKEGKVKLDELDTYTTWLRRIVDWQKGTPEADEFLHELKMDLFHDEIFLFTPKGDLLQLPVDSTPVDFAFALHSEIGLHTSAAKVNGRMVPLDTKLKNGQWVDITTNPKKNPNPEWLNSIKTAKARSLIRRWIKQQRYEESKTLGMELLDKIEKQIGRILTTDDQTRIMKKYQVSTWNKFLASLGLGEISLQSIYAFFGLTTQKKKGILTTEIPKPSVSIQGMENLLVNFAKCCKPLPGDDIIGFVTRGRGLIIHRSDCENIQNLAEDDRLIQMNWQPKNDLLFVASIRVEATDRKELLSDIIAAISRCNCDIRNARINTTDLIAINDFDVNVRSLADLQRLMKEIRSVKGVVKVRRLDSRSPEYFEKSHEEN